MGGCGTADFRSRASRASRRQDAVDGSTCTSAIARHRRGYGAMISVWRNPDQLPNARQLVLHERSRPAAYMAVDARYPVMRRLLIPDILRSHYGMTGLAAELSGVHDRDSMVSRR